MVDRESLPTMTDSSKQHISAASYTLVENPRSMTIRILSSSLVACCCIVVMAVVPFHLNGAECDSVKADPCVKVVLIVDSVSTSILVDVSANSDTIFIRADYWLVCFAEYPKCGLHPSDDLTANTLSFMDVPVREGSLSQVDYLDYPECIPLMIRVLPNTRTQLVIGVPSSDTVRNELENGRRFFVTLPYWRKLPRPKNVILLPDRSTHSFTPSCGMPSSQDYYVQYSCSTSDLSYMRLEGNAWFTDPEIAKMLEAEGSVAKTARSK